MHSVGPKTSSCGTDRIPSVMAIRASGKRSFSTAALVLLLTGAGSGCERSADVALEFGVPFDTAPDVAPDLASGDIASETRDLTQLPSRWDTCAAPDAGQVPGAGWAKQFGGDGWTAVVGIAASPDGRFYLTGNFTGTVTFGRGEANETTLTATTPANNAFRAGADIFIAGFNADGTLAWVKHPVNRHAGTRNSGMAVAAHESCDLVVVGELNDTLTFGAGEPGETTLAPALLPNFDPPMPNSDGFMARYRSDGTLVWARRFGSSRLGFTTPGAVAVEAEAGIFVSGSFGPESTFGPGEPEETTLRQADTSPSAPDTAGFVARFRAVDGTLVWALRAGGGCGSCPLPTVAARGRDLFVAGEAAATTPFDSRTMPAGSIAWPGAFVARYSADGTLAWVRATKPTNGTADHAMASGIALFPDGSPVVIGPFFGTIIFGSGEKSETMLISSGSGDKLFVARYGDDGSLAWVRRTEGTYNLIPHGLSVTPSGTAVLTGFMEDSVTLGPGEPHETTLMLVDGPRTSNGFAAGYGGDGLLKWAVNFGGAHLTHGSGVTATIDGSAIVAGFFDRSVRFGPGTKLDAAPGATDGFHVRFRNADDKAVLP